ncbi:MAG: HYR domain-containing protein [Lewinellaceae bacterium]|nr:HYR domain-containing protein [Lewinellaceae bacterium]
MLKRPTTSPLLRYSGLLLCALVWLANNNNPPNGRTGAPFDGHCNNCHNGSNPNGYDGTVFITGLPSTIEPNMVYNLTLTLNPTAGNPSKGGYQMVVVDGNNANCGNLAATNPQSGTEFSGGREYIEQRGGKTFGGGSVSWDFDWTSPITAGGNTIKFYFIGNFTNGNGNDSGDFAAAFSETYSFAGAPPVTATIISSTNVLCNGSNTGSATAEGAGGVPPYTYLWSNGQSGATAVNLTAGNYTVTVTGAGGSGTATTNVTITQPTAIALSVSSNGTITCSNPTVTATANASGGAGSFYFEWSNGNIGAQSDFNTAGTYFVTVTDANDCSKTSSVTIVGNTIQPTAAASSGGSISCQNPLVTLSGSGSSTGPNFQYFWTTTNGNIVSGATTLNPTINLPGTYLLTVTNIANGCTASASTTVAGDISAPVVTVSGGTLTCSTTSVQITANANEPASYQWSGPNGFSSSQQNPTVSSSGAYIVTVTAADNGCTAAATTTVGNNTNPPTIAASVGGQLTCIQTTVTINLTTNPACSVIWVGPNGFSTSQQNPQVDAPGTYSVTATSQTNGCTAVSAVTVVQNIVPPQLSATGGLLNCIETTDTLLASSTDNTASFAWVGPNNYQATGSSAIVTAPGNYTVTATSATNGCASTATSIVTQNTTTPTASATTPVQITCMEPVIQLNGVASSQGGNFVYLWTTADGNIISGGTTLMPTVNAIGAYTLNVTNTSTGCSASTVVVVSQNAALMVAIDSIVPVGCFENSNGSLNVQASGGDGIYQYLWSTGDTTPTISGLAAGIYMATVSDASGCTAVVQDTITQPNALFANAAATGETALGENDGTATASPSGGTPPFMYLWNNGAMSAVIDSLSPGTYTVTVTDANTCSVEQSVTVNSFNCSLMANIASSPVSCNGASNGMATVFITGAADPVSYLWSNGDTTTTVVNLLAGTYSVSVVDNNNCSATLTVNITQPAALSTNATATGETSLGANNGTATAAPTGGSSPYTYLWSTGATTQGITGLAPGSYTVTVTDSKGCTKSKTVQVSSFNCMLMTSTTQADVGCHGAATGQITLSVAGGQLPYAYTWSNGDTTATISGLVAGVYTVSVADISGCTAIASATISEPAALVVDTIIVTNVACPELANGMAQIVLSGGTVPYSFSPNQTSNLAIGNYTVTITDSNNCSTLAMFAVVSEDQTPPELLCPTSPTMACEGDTIWFEYPGFSDNCSLAGIEPMLISGLPSGVVFPVGLTIQEYLLTDASGNSSNCSFTVSVSEAPLASLVSVVHDMDNLGQGSIQIDVASGSILEWSGPNGFSGSTALVEGLFSGTYFVKIINEVGCSTMLGPIVVDNTVASNEPHLIPLAFRVIPNPASSLVRLEIPASVQIVSVVVRNQFGQLVKRLSVEEWQNTIAVDEYPAGLYLFQLRDVGGKQWVVKWIKGDQ